MDGLIKTLLDDKNIRLVSGKGVFFNCNKNDSQHGTKSAMGVILAGWGSNAKIFAGPEAICGASLEDGPHIVVSSTGRTVHYVGLNGYSKDDPRGHGYVLNCNAHQLSVSQYLPTIPRVISTMAGQSPITITTASPELALALLPNSANRRAKFDSTGTIKVIDVKDGKVLLDVLNPVTGTTKSATIDAVVFWKQISAIPLDSTGLAGSIRNGLKLVSSGRVTLNEALKEGYDQVSHPKRPRMSNDLLDDLDISMPSLRTKPGI
jgi:hypothetical protein